MREPGARVTSAARLYGHRFSRRSTESAVVAVSFCQVEKGSGPSAMLAGTRLEVVLRRLFLAAVAVAQVASSAPLPPDAYEVYAAVFPSQRPVADGRAKLLVIRDTTKASGAGCFPSGGPLRSGEWKNA